MNRPDPVKFARASYILAHVSVLLLLLGFLAGIIKIYNLIWLAVPASAAGAFTGYASRQDFKEKPGDEEFMRQAQIGFRVNIATLGLLVILIAMRVTFALLGS